MNQTQTYMDMHPASHMSTGPSYSHTATASAMPHYPHYPQTAVMPPSSAHYGHGPTYGYGYGNPVTSPQSAGPLPSMMASAGAQPYGHASGGPAPGYAAQPPAPFDTSGQVAPPGMKPRVTATLWEDEGSLCFQVEAKGVCVARREDNHFINGTKLLNVAGMTRGRRDGILKSEKTRHVVKIGPMHLKGVWIPFERALEFANKEKITDQLYPLFVHNIGSLLYNPENASRTSGGGVVQTADRRRLEGSDAPRAAQGAQPSSLHHHHSMQNGNASQVPPTPHSIGGAGRPGIDRAHTFPTPPTSASSVMGIGGSGSSYDWNASGMSNGVTGSQPLSIDTGLNNTRSMPTTPATTPPGNNVANMNGYQSHQGYDSKHYYAHTPSSQTGYSQQQGGRYDSYGKTDMGPPTAPPSGSSDTHEAKPEPYGTGHAAAESNEHQDGGYMTTSGGAYNRSYAYNHTAEHQHLSPEMTNSPSHQNASGRGTPRTMPNTQSWPQDYQTPPRGPPNNLYNTVGDSRNPNANDAYATSNYTATGKRGRDDDDDKADAYKRPKMARPDTFGMPLTPNVHMQTIKTGGGLPGQR